MCLNTNQFHFRTTPPENAAFTILTVGRFVEKKGHQYALRAVALLKEAGLTFKYHLIGEGPLLEDMKQLAAELGIMDSVVFHGAMMQNAVIDFYHQSDVFLLPSITAENGDTEGQGLVLQEAQAIGLPIVATLHNGFPDSVIDAKTGFLVPEKDFSGLYEKLLLLARNPELRSTMGRHGRTFVESNFDSSVIGKELSAIYTMMLSVK